MVLLIRRIFWLMLLPVFSVMWGLLFIMEGPAEASDLIASTYPK